MLIDLRTQARARMPALPSEAKRQDLSSSARATWLARMVNEYSSSRVFDALADQMDDRRVGNDWSTPCRAFADEERKHGVLCGAVVEALGGVAVAPVRVEHDLPSHASAGAIEGVMRNVLSIACLSETVAVSLIGAERMEMPAGPLRDLLTLIWADEIGHARFGLKFAEAVVPWLPHAQRERLGAYLAVAFAHLEQHELSHLPLSADPPTEGAALGLCSGASARELFYATVEEVIVPNLAALGVDARAAWEARRTPKAA